MTTLLLATTNAGKLREIRDVLAGLAIRASARSPTIPPLPEPEETGRTFEENARQKALYYAAATGALVVAEDSGLEIDALDGAPGVYSARFGGDEAPDLSREVRADLPDARRSAGRRRAPRGSCARWRWPGRARSSSRRAARSRGASRRRRAARGGFGYDPIFFYPPFGCTLAEVPAERKSSVSHRGQAFRALREITGGLRAQGSGLRARRQALQGGALALPISLASTSGAHRNAPVAEVRLDVWLDVACLYKTRSEAQKACNGGKVGINGHSAKPHRPAHVGDELRITRTHGRRQVVVVRALADRHVPKADARAALRGSDAAADAGGDRAAGAPARVPPVVRRAAPARARQARAPGTAQAQGTLIGGTFFVRERRPRAPTRRTSAP